MIFLALFGLLIAAVVVHGVLNHRRYPPRTLGEAGFSLQPEEKVSAGATVFIGLAAIGCLLASGLIVWKLIQSGRPYLAVGAWAIFLAALVAIQHWRMGRVRQCAKCRTPMQMYRMEHGGSPAEILFLHVCENCKAYQSQRVLNISSED